MTLTFGDVGPIKQVMGLWLKELPPEDQRLLKPAELDQVLAQAVGSMRQFISDRKIMTAPAGLGPDLFELVGLMTKEGRPQAVTLLWAEYARTLNGPNGEAESGALRKRIGDLLHPLVYNIPREGEAPIPTTQNLDALVEETARQQAEVKANHGLWSTKFFHPLDQAVTDLLKEGKLEEALAIKSRFEVLVQAGSSKSEGAQKFTGGVQAEPLPTTRLTASYEKVPSVGVMTQVNRAFALDGMGKSSEALKLYRQVGPELSALNDPKKSAIYFERLGRCWLNLGELQTARENCLEALGHNPQYAPAQYSLAAIALAQGQKREAVGWLEMAVKADPTHFQNQARNDPDFNALRGDATFRKLVGLPALATAPSESR